MAVNGIDRDAPGRLTAVHGTALYVGAVLGTAVIALPALGARAAGPASLLAWLVLVLLSIALATTFAALGARYPDAGGVSTYVRRAFGAQAAAVAGWCFTWLRYRLELRPRGCSPADTSPRRSTAGVPAC